MYAIKFRNEDGNNYLAEKMGKSVSFWSSCRGDAWLFFNRAYAEKIATMLDNEIGREPIRGRVHVVHMVLR